MYSLVCSAWMVFRLLVQTLLVYIVAMYKQTYLGVMRMLFVSVTSVMMYACSPSVVIELFLLS